VSELERIYEAAHRLVTATDEDEYLHALTELRDEIAEPATTTVYTNTLIGGYQR
jgi:hypothetical protein